MDRDFCRQLLTNPADNAVRLVYADWLMEHGEEDKSVFLRRLVDYMTGDDAALEDVRRLSVSFEPAWLAIVSAPPIENCGRFDPVERERQERWWVLASRPYGPNNEHRSHPENTLDEWLANHPRGRFDFICHKKWSDMEATDNVKVRHCPECKESVHFCDDIIEARRLGNEGRCISVDLGIIRRENDLIDEIAFFGRPGPGTRQREEERRKPDPVSAARIVAKHYRDSHVQPGEQEEAS